MIKATLFNFKNYKKDNDPMFPKDILPRINRQKNCRYPIKKPPIKGKHGVCDVPSPLILLHAFPKPRNGSCGETR